MSWIVVNIGCIECGVSSNIVGVFGDEERAKAIAATLDEEMSWREGGQNAYEVFPLPPLNVVHEEYRDALMTIDAGHEAVQGSGEIAGDGPAVLTAKLLSRFDN